MATAELNSAVTRWRQDPGFFAKSVLGVTTLWAKQIEILEALRDHRRVAVPSCHESGKALSLDTPLPTPTGWTTMEAVSVGDQLLDEEGRPARVIATSPVEERECYRVRFSDGSQILASDDHRWLVQDLCFRKRRVVDWRDHWDDTELLTTEEMADEVLESGQRRWRVPACRALRTSVEWRLDSDPYTFGAWLGNGTTVRAELTCHVDDAPHYALATGGVVLAEKKDTVKKVRFRKRTTVHCPVREIGGIKCIPDFVLRASRADRMAVVQGLMDTDGYMAGRSRVEITLCKEVLADGAEELFRSMGWVTTRAASPAKIYGRVVGTQHRIGFRPDVKPLTLKRKADAWDEANANCGSQRSRRTQRTVTAVEEAGVRRVKCVMVDSPRSLYLCSKAMIPTHNTFVASVAAVHHLMSHQPSKVITTAPTNRQVKDLLWSEIRARHAGMKRHLGGDPGLGSPTMVHWQIPGESDWFATGFATSPDKAQESAVRMTGYHSPNLLVILDEAGGINREVWAAVDSLLTSGTAKVLAIGNPSSGTEFERICRSPDWHVRRISAFDCPNLRNPDKPQPWGVTRKWIDEMRRRWGEGSVVYQTKVLGLFPSTSVDTLLSIGEVERAMSRMPPQEDKSLVSLGVDVARFGNDETVIVVRQGPRIVEIESWTGQDTMRTAGCVIQLARKHGLDFNTSYRISVDDTGVGGGVVDRLREQHWRILAVNFGAKATTESEEIKFVNQRTQMWWNLREWIRKDAALGDLNPDVQDILRADLCAPKYEMKSDGRVALEQKSKIRQRTGRSPDYGDALALAVMPVRRGLVFTPRPRNEERERQAERTRRFMRSLERDYSPGGRGLSGW